MVRQNLPSKRYVPEEFRNCTQKPFQKCPNIGRNHYCYAAFDRFSVTNESIWGFQNAPMKKMYTEKIVNVKT